MKLEVKEKYLSMSPSQFILRCGYGHLVDPQTGQESYSRRFGREFYPRFHLYLEEKTENGDRIAIFNLHLDQKKASYEGFSRHSGEYDGPLVEEEIARLRSLVIADYQGQKN